MPAEPVTLERMSLEDIDSLVPKSSIARPVVDVALPILRAGYAQEKNDSIIELSNYIQSVVEDVIEATNGVQGDDVPWRFQEDLERLESTFQEILAFLSRPRQGRLLQLIKKREHTETIKRFTARLDDVLQSFALRREVTTSLLIEKLAKLPSREQGRRQLDEDRENRSDMVAPPSETMQKLLDSLASHIVSVRKMGVHPVAAGGFSDVWKGQLVQSLDERVALKILRLTASGPAIYNRFAREATIWSRLHHSNVLPFIGVSFQFGYQSLCVVSPWVEAGSVNVFLSRSPGADRVEIIRGIRNGLSFLHNNGVVHADLKGDNILIAADGRPLLADFGLSILLEDQGDVATTTSAFMGSTRWMAPERLQPQQFEISARSSRTTASDIYSLGMVIYEIMSERIPFHGINKWAVSAMVVGGKRPEHPGAAAIQHGLTPALWLFVLQCWLGRPSVRPTLSELDAALEDFGDIMPSLDGFSSYWN